MSPVLENIYLSTGIDTVYILGAMLVLIIILLVLSIVALVKIRKLNKRYKTFMRGKDAESLEDIILTGIDSTEQVAELNKKMQNDIAALRKNQKITYQKMGMVKYNAFREMSGDLSYALALLDQDDNGFLINSVYTKEGGYSYIKEIKNGESSIELSEDEKIALDRARGV